jgi:hypothetical protein
MIPHWVEILPVAPNRLAWYLLILAYLTVWTFSVGVQRRFAKRLFGETHQRQGLIWLPMMLQLGALCLIAYAASDPRSGSALMSVRRPSLQVVFVLDRSRSMLAEDVAEGVSRLDLGRRLIHDVVEVSPGTPIALVTFAGDVRIDVPLSRDHLAVGNALEQVDPNHNVFFGSNLIEAVTESLDCFADRIAGEKRLIVITDAEIPSGAGIPAFTNMPDRTDVDLVVLGDAKTGGRIPMPDSRSFLIHEGEIVWTKAQPETAQALAAATGGTTDHIESMDAFSKVSRRIRSSIQRQFQQQDEAGIATINLAKPLYGWFVLIALGMLSADYLLATRKQDSQRLSTRPIRSVLFSLVGLAALLGAGPSGSVPIVESALSLPYRLRVMRYNDAVDAYRNQDYETAERLFLASSQDEDLGLRRRSTFNLANTIYHSVVHGGLTKQQAIQRLSTAAELYRQCIELGHRPDDAAANIKIVQALITQIEQQAPDPGGSSAEPESDQTDQEPNERLGDQDEPRPSDAPKPSGDRRDDSDDRARSDGGQHGPSPPSLSDPPGRRDPPGPADQPARQPLDQGQAQSLLNDIRERASNRESLDHLGQVPADLGASPPISSMPW